jgi:hypothetical protein
VSDETSRTISAIYEKNIYVNKLVIKLNTIVTRPSINIYLNGSIISVDGSNTIQMPVNSENVCTGMLVCTGVVLLGQRQNGTLLNSQYSRILDH